MRIALQTGYRHIDTAAAYQYVSCGFSSCESRFNIFIGMRKVSAKEFSCVFLEEYFNARLIESVSSHPASLVRMSS